jgi:hypothetical protein
MLVRAIRSSDEQLSLIIAVNETCTVSENESSLNARTTSWENQGCVSRIVDPDREAGFDDFALLWREPKSFVNTRPKIEASRFRGRRFEKRTIRVLK